MEHLTRSGSSGHNQPNLKIESCKSIIPRNTTKHSTNSVCICTSKSVKCTAVPNHEWLSVAKLKPSNMQASRTGQITHSPPVVPVVHMMAFMDPDSDIFMRVAQNAYKEHMEELVPCKTCGRKFFPDRIIRHASNCCATPTPAKTKTNLKKSITFSKLQAHTTTSVTTVTSAGGTDKVAAPAALKSSTTCQKTSSSRFGCMKPSLPQGQNTINSKLTYQLLSKTSNRFSP